MLNEIQLPKNLALRDADSADDAYMEKLFRSTREYLYLLNMPKQGIDILIAQQYQLQRLSYAQHYPNARQYLIQEYSSSIGQIILNSEKNILHIIDFTIAPEMRGQGRGTAIIQALQAAASDVNGTIKLSVDRQNIAAKKMYLTLGFCVTGETDTHESMVWPSLN